MKGPVMPGKQFFLQAFGRDAEEFKAILSMPEEFIRNRLVSNWKDLNSIEARWMPYVRDWMTEFARLSPADKETLTRAIAYSDNKLVKEQHAKSIGRVKKLLEFHLEENNIVSAAKKQYVTV
jgi:hypothetical protein